MLHLDFIFVQSKYWKQKKNHFVCWSATDLAFLFLNFRSQQCKGEKCLSCSFSNTLVLHLSRRCILQICVPYSICNLALAAFRINHILEPQNHGCHKLLVVLPAFIEIYIRFEGLKYVGIHVETCYFCTIKWNFWERSTTGIQTQTWCSSAINQRLWPKVSALEYLFHW